MTTITFETWRNQFEKSIAHGTPVWTALQTFTEYVKQPASKLPTWLVFLLGEDPDWPNDIRKVVLKMMYRLTLPEPQLDKNKQGRDAYV